MQSKFLADENIPRICVIKIREKGFDVNWISEIESSISDLAVCSLAQSENRIILTNDKDFGEMVFRKRILVPGVILLRFDKLLPPEISAIVTQALSQTHDWEGQFTVITEKIIRIRSLPN